MGNCWQTRLGRWIVVLLAVLLPLGATAVFAQTTAQLPRIDVPASVQANVPEGQAIPKLRLQFPLRVETAAGFLTLTDATRPAGTLIYDTQNANLALDLLPPTMVLLIDTSGSIAPTFAEVQAAATAVVESAPFDTRFAVLTFNGAVEMALPFTADHDRVVQTIAGLTPGEEATCLYDGLAVAHDTLHRQLDRREKTLQRQGVILFSDGWDETVQGSGVFCSQRTLKEPGYPLADTPLYLFGFDGDRGPDAARDQNATALALLAERSGGQYLQLTAQSLWQSIGSMWWATADLFTGAGAQTADLRLSLPPLGTLTRQLSFTAQTGTMPNESLSPFECSYDRLHNQVAVEKLPARIKPQPHAQWRLTFNEAITPTQIFSVDTRPAPIVLNENLSTGNPQKYTLLLTPLDEDGQPIRSLLGEKEELQQKCQFTYDPLPETQLTILPPPAAPKPGEPFSIPVWVSAPQRVEDVNVYLLQRRIWPWRPRLVQLDDATKPTSFSTLKSAGMGDTFNATVVVTPAMALSDMLYGDVLLRPSHRLFVETVLPEQSRPQVAVYRPPTLLERTAAFISENGTQPQRLGQAFGVSLLIFLLCVGLLLWLWLDKRRAAAPTAVTAAQATTNPTLSFSIKSKVTDETFEPILLRAEAQAQRPFTIGRVDCDYNLPQDGRLAARHVQIRFNRGTYRFEVMDLDSANGTWLDKHKLTPYEWQPIRPDAETVQLNLGSKTILEKMSANGNGAAPEKE